MVRGEATDSNQRGNRTRLTQQGLDLVQEILEEIDNHSCHSQSPLLTSKQRLVVSRLVKRLELVGIVIDRDRLSKMISKKNRNRMLAFQGSSIDKLFYGLDILLKKCSREPRGLSPEKYREYISVPRSENKVYINSGKLTSTINEMREALYRLNYEPQRSVFREFIGSCRESGIFIVQGQRGSLHKWLVDLLMFEYLPPPIDIEQRLYVGIPDTKKLLYVTDLWLFLYTSWFAKKDKRALLPQNISANQLVDRVFDIWKRDHVSIVIDRLERMPASQPKMIVEQFWNPLIEKIERERESEGGYTVYLFLIHRCDTASEWGFCYGKPELTTITSNPIELPSIGTIGYAEIKQWRERNRTLFERSFNSRQAKEFSKRVYSESRSGVPEYTMEAICKRCGLDWNEMHPVLEFEYPLEFK